MRFVCDTTDDGEAIVLVALNPVTKDEVKISPPFVWKDWEELNVFCRNFEVYCQVTWHFSHSSPSEIDTSRWPQYAPRIMLDPSIPEPAPVVELDTETTG